MIGTKKQTRQPAVIKTTVRASTYLQATYRKSIGHRFTCFVLKQVEKLTGSRLDIEIPPVLAAISSNALALTGPSSPARALQKKRVITSINRLSREFADEPQIFTFTATSCTHPKQDGYGADFTSETSALWKAVGESQERYLWYEHDFYSHQAIVSSFKLIKDKSINITKLAGFSDTLRNQHRHLQFDENTLFTWIKIFSLTKENYAYCPVQLLSSRYVTNHVYNNLNDHSEPLLRPSITTGLASGTNKTDATVAATLEVIERDAFMITYLNQLSPESIDLTHLAKQDDEIAEILFNFKKYNIAINLVRLVTDFSVTAIGGIAVDENTSGPTVVVAAKADFDIKKAILGTLAELASVRKLARSLMAHNLDTSVNSQLDLHGRTAYWAMQKDATLIDFMRQGNTVKISLPNKANQQSTRYTDANLHKLISDFKNKGLPLYRSDMTIGVDLDTGIETVCVIAPDLHPLHPFETEPCLFSDRLKQVPVSLGYRVTNTTNAIPHPFS